MLTLRDTNGDGRADEVRTAVRRPMLHGIALGGATDRMRFIQARHEELAAFMACAHAKFTGEVGVCLATSGPGAIHPVPYAIAAKFCYPDRVAFALAGDGAMQVAGINGMITIAKYWREWRDPRLVVLVLNNRDLNMVTWEQRALAGDPKFEASQVLPDFPGTARFVPIVLR